MAYIPSVLNQNETVKHLGKPSWTLILPRTVLCGVAAIVYMVIAAITSSWAVAGLAFGIITLLWAILVGNIVLYILTTEIAVTNQRVVSKHGWLNINVTSTHLDKINNVNVFQSLLGRILNYGNIEITTATAEEKDNHFIKSLGKPNVFRESLMTELERYDVSH